jgi:hypothetical protein
MGGGGKSGDDKEPGGFLNPKNSDLVFGKGGLLNPNKVKKPQQPGGMLAGEVSAEDASKAAKLAADKKKKQAIAAYGYSDTNLTGGKLGAPPAANLNYQTILGG